MDPIRGKYIFDFDIPRNHELKYKKMLRASFVYEISLIPYLHLFLDPIRGFTREPNGSEPQGSVLFIRSSSSQTGAYKLEPVCTVGLSVLVWDRSRTDPLSCTRGLNLHVMVRNAVEK